ncbi:MAG TPA: HNH endonuclease [Chitinophagaceae bacterium]|nr:HNH endonuclease [Chitinophagaceae bacterium]
MKFYLGVTDNSWYNFLSHQNREDVNFWQPRGASGFKILTPGAPFLFKLKSPNHAIGGIGFFSSHTFLPISIAWDTFKEGNGCESFQILQRMIVRYRQDKANENPIIGCIVLTNPIFFRKEDWITVPEDWSASIVQGKSYSTDLEIGQKVWNKVEQVLQKYLYPILDEDKSQLMLEDAEPIYGNSILRKVRLGQGAFRVLVTDAYNRKCAISGEKTLPVLESAHIKPYALSGPHYIANALLLRSDLHKLFDCGYLTITTDLKVEVSKRIKEEFENGKEYYKFHGSNLGNLPTRLMDRPESRFVEWHNENVYKS